MPTLVDRPTIIQATDNKPERIEESAGRVNSGHERVSVARMRSPAGWTEPGQRPEFEESTVSSIAIPRRDPLRSASSRSPLVRFLAGITDR